MEKSEWDNLMKQGIIVVNKNPDEQGKIKRTSFLAWLKTETAYFFRNFFRPWRIFTDVEATSEIGARMDEVNKRIDALEKKTDSIIRYSDYLSECIQGVKDELNSSQTHKQI